MVEIKVVEEKKNRLTVQLEGADHTLCNSLKAELWNDSHVKLAGYNINHPLIGIPTMIIETDSGETPKKALVEAAKRLKKINEKLGKDIVKELR
jgi:DNA-directed RNA polymerase subunit L